MLRTSSYIIYVDLGDSNEDMLLVHGYTGAYDRVARHLASYLRSLEPDRPRRSPGRDWNSEPPIGEVTPPSEETIKVLKRRGYLTEKTVEGEAAFFAKMATTLRDQAARRRPGYIFMPTYNCNLRCPYCYQDHMRSDPAFEHLLGATMRPELVDQVFEAMPQIEAHHNAPENDKRRLSIGFYGGEPLLAQNRSIVEYIINKALAQGEANFSAVTNGTELHAYRDLLGPTKIASLQITLDGPPYEHDQRRVYADGSGSFERVAQNITLALDLDVRVSVRANIDHSNIGQLPALADEIVARGWDHYTKFSAYTSVVNAANKKTDAGATMSSWGLDKALAEMCQQYPNMRVIQGPDDGMKNRIRRIFDKQANPLPDFRASFCAAHTSMYIVDPFGGLYACWERTGDPGMRIGHITEGGNVVFNSELEQTWRNRTVMSNPTCRQCRYAFYCGGGCAARALNYRNEFFTSYCDGFVARFKDSAAEAYLDFIAGRPVVQQEQVCEV